VKSSQADTMSCELFVGNLNPEVRIRDLENCFGRYGKIVRCDLKKNFGFIQLGDKRDAEEAIRKENNRRLLGSVMTVEWAKGSVGDEGKGPRQGGPPGGFRKQRSPNRFNGGGNGGGRPPMRERSPFGGGGRPPMRDRSPVGRGGPGGGMPRSNGFTPRDDKFGAGGNRRFSGGGGGGRDNFDSPRFDRGGPRGGGGDRFPQRDRFQGPDRFNDRGPSNRGPPSNDRGPNRGPPRDNGYNDRPRNGGSFNERRQSFGERRNFSGPRRF